MSNTFKRPMFRKGGDVGGGIMDNVVDRRQYAASNADDLNIKKDVGLNLGDRIDTVLSAGGNTGGLNDPLTQFLLQYGPALSTQTGGGSTIGNIVAASKGPTTDLLKNLRDDKKTRQAVALDLYKDLNDSDKIALEKEVKYLMKEFNLTKEEALERASPLFRKRKDPTEQDMQNKSDIIDSFIKVTSNMYGTPTIDRGQGELIYNDVMALKDKDPGAYNEFMRIKGKSKFIFARGMYEGDLSSGAQIGERTTLRKAPEGVPIYDISTGKFIIRQGNTVKEYVSESINEE